MKSELYMKGRAIAQVLHVNIMPVTAEIWVRILFQHSIGSAE
jgi:hypothetical protein